jgi:FtsP/CotA-like multicopper oxidase with cupredoxin domain
MYVALLRGIGHALLATLSLSYLSSGAHSDELADRSLSYSQHDRAQSLSRDVSYYTPPEIKPGSTCTTVDLRVVETINRFNGIDLRHRTYNRGLVGPTVYVQPGQTLKVRLQNDLTAEPPGTHAGNEPHGFNTTNLHTHGLHVSPKSPADNVFLEIGPGQSFDFAFEILPEHPAGTFWYHAHKHGSTALQLASGMAGALIVRGGLDEIPEIKAAEVQIMVLQQFAYKELGSEPAIIDPDHLYSGEGDIVEAINGVVTPTIVMRPGEVQRWRIIHGGTSEAIFLNAEGVNFYEIAVDGIATGRLELKNSLQLYPGYRSDVLVKAPPAEGPRLMYTLIRDPEKTIRNQATERSNLLRIVVEGEPKEMPLPSEEALRKVAPLGNDDVPAETEIVKRRTLRFAEEDDSFTIDGQEFDPTNIAHSIQLDTAEEWELISDSGTHPFHIHVNPFAVKPEEEGQPWVWRDTIVVRKRHPVTIRSRFKKHAGKTVLHCHNLTHEDQGMMQAIEIVDAGQALARDTTGLAPSWSASERSGRTFSSREYQAKLTMLVFHRGMECIHCAA